MIKDIKIIKGPQIALYGGGYFDFINPMESPFTIEDIAHGLAMTCRFGGQCKRFYSVAEHSFYVSNLVSGEGEGSLYGLMHDAAEAFIGDIPKPLKKLLLDINIIEKRVELAIFNKFNLSQKEAFFYYSEIRRADLSMLATERFALFEDDLTKWESIEGVEPNSTTLNFWKPKKAEKMFLKRYKELI